MERTKHNGTETLPMKRTQPVVKKRKKTYNGKFQEWMIAESQELVGKLGARNQELADAFEVGVSTIEQWLRERPEFAQAVRRGRVQSGLRVSQALYSKAIGHEYIDTVVVNNVVKEYHENGKIARQYNDPITLEIPKKLPPDAYAAHKYLSIVFRDIWADSQKVDVNHQHSGNVNFTQVTELSMDNLSEDVQKFLFDLNLQQLSDAQNN